MPLDSVRIPTKQATGTRYRVPAAGNLSSVVGRRTINFLSPLDLVNDQQPNTPQFNGTSKYFKIYFNSTIFLQILCSYVKKLGVGVGEGKTPVIMT